MHRAGVVPTNSPDSHINCAHKLWHGAEYFGVFIKAILGQILITRNVAEDQHVAWNDCRLSKCNIQVPALWNTMYVPKSACLAYTTTPEQEYTGRKHNQPGCSGDVHTHTHTHTHTRFHFFFGLSFDLAHGSKFEQISSIKYLSSRKNGKTWLKQYQRDATMMVYSLRMYILINNMLRTWSCL